MRPLLFAGLALSVAAIQPVERRVYVAVADADGRPAAEVVGDAFHIWESGKTREVVKGEPAKAPLSMVLIVHGVPSRDMENTRRAMTTVVETLRARAPESRLALVTSVVTPRLAGVTASAAAFSDQINHFTSSGSGLVLFEALEDAARVLKNEPTDRRAVLVFAHAAKADPERRTAKAVAETLRSAGVSLWSAFIALDRGSQVEALHINTETSNLLHAVPIISGGLGVNVIGTIGLPEMAGRLTSLVASQYSVTYMRPADAGEQEIRVGVRGPEGQKILAPTWLVK